MDSCWIIVRVLLKKLFYEESLCAFIQCSFNSSMCTPKFLLVQYSYEYCVRKHREALVTTVQQRFIGSTTPKTAIALIESRLTHGS